MIRNSSARTGERSAAFARRQETRCCRRCWGLRQRRTGHASSRFSVLRQRQPYAGGDCAPRSTLCRLMRQQLTANHVLRASARSDAPEPLDTAWAMYDGRRPTCLIASAVGQWDSGYVMRPSVQCSRSRETESGRLSMCVPPCCPIQSPFIYVSCPLYWSLPNATFHPEAH